MPILATLLERLEDDVLLNGIDTSLDLSWHIFILDQCENITHEKFNTTIASFYRQIFGHGIMDDLEMTSAEAFGEAVFIIERYYRGNETRGYDGALFDTQGDEGLALVLDRIIEIIKSEERRKRIYWIIQSTFDPADWDLKKDLSIEILERFGHLLPEAFGKLSNAQLALHIEELIYMLTLPFIP
jgi:hypothetical protein